MKRAIGINVTSSEYDVMCGSRMSAQSYRRA